ncbi:MAG: phosphatase PAP2 family protein [Rhodospirillales bacterium]|nr:phosphatase PAP2 family protein [Rhodospirillales bacterium]
MFGFDAAVVKALNQFAAQSSLFDHIMYLVGFSDLIKGGVPTALLWWCWFRGGESAARDRRILLVAIVGGLAALVLGKVIAEFVPFRLRPFEEPSLGFVPPLWLKKPPASEWSSFPSDHVDLFMSLAIGIWLVSRRLGALAVAHVLIVIGLTRVYLGYHYPTDILASAAVAATATMASVFLFRDHAATFVVLRWESRHPASFYALFLLLGGELVTRFVEVRFLLEIAE